MSWTEDILRYLGSSSSRIKGIREDKWWAGGGGQAGIKRVGSKAEEYNTNHHNPRQSSPRTGGISKPREEERERDVKLKNKTCFSF